jgi:hypothetical protein
MLINPNLQQFVLNGYYEYKTGTTYTQIGGRDWNRDLVVIWESYSNEETVRGGQR